MPSQAYRDFLNTIDGVNRFFDSHKQLSPQKPGRRALGHITGGCVVALGASWEQYIKSMLITSVDFVQTAGFAKSPTKLPAPVQDTINEILKKSKGFKPLDLAEDGWCKFYDRDAKRTIDNFYSQKSYSVASIFQKYIGITPDELFNCWSVDKKDAPRKRIDQIVSTRNRIAHAGLKEGDYPQFQTVWQYKVDVMTTVRETDNFLHEKLKPFSPGGNVPWKKAAKLTEREKYLSNYKGLPRKAH